MAQLELAPQGLSWTKAKPFLQEAQKRGHVVGSVQGWDIQRGYVL